MTAEKRLSLRTKRDIVDRFMAGESLARVAFELLTPKTGDLGHMTKIVENVLRWSSKSATERRRLWRHLTKAGPKPKKPRKGGRK